MPDATVDAIETALKVSGIPIPALPANFTTPFIQVNDALIVLGVKHDQTIIFFSIPNLYYGVSDLLSAVASSGLPVTYNSLTPLICTVTNTIQRESLFLRKIFPGFLLEKSAKITRPPMPSAAPIRPRHLCFDPTRGRNIGSK